MENNEVYLGVNKNTYDMLFGDRHNIPFEKWTEYEDLEAIVIIDKFTREDRNSFPKKALNHLNKDFKRISYNNETGMYEYEHNGTYYQFKKLSDCIPDKEITKELQSKKRYGKCHHRSLRLAPNIKKSKVSTGYITLGKDKILHSVVEYSRKGKTIILDWTKNLYMEKEDYVKLFNYEELSSFEGYKVLEDQDGLIWELLENITIKAYVLFRDQIVSEIEKITKNEEPEKKLVLKK